MMQPLLLGAIALLYLLFLFAVARFGDTHRDASVFRSRTTIYPLSLAIYCTTWTFFGSVGLAATSGITFLAIYIGPILMMTVGFPILKNIVSLSKRQRSTSVADFMGARYGKSAWVAAVATCISVIGAVPYISLQLKAVSLSLTQLISPNGIAFSVGIPLFSDISLIIVIGLAIFTILFGTRHADATEHQYGLMLAIALESAIKLAAFLIVGIFVIYFMFDGFQDLYSQSMANKAVQGIIENGIDYGNMLVLTFLSLIAFLLLPRQFHVAIVENHSERELNRARWLFPLYLVAINVFVIPIAAAGIVTFGDSGNADGFVLALPEIAGSQFISLVTFVGGLSAGTAMVIVACVALAIMVSNHIVLPLYLRGSAKNVREDGVDMERRILNIRRTAITLLLGLAYIYYKAADNAQPLASIGLVSFAAAAQLAPAFFGGLIWRGANATGAITGMLVGTLAWAYTLFLPTLTSSETVLGLSFIPRDTFPNMGLTPLAGGVLLSLTLNIMGWIFGSLAKRPTSIESHQAMLFVSHRGNAPDAERKISGLVTIDQVNANLARYLGKDRAKRAFERYWDKAGYVAEANDPASVDYIQFSESTLASAIGSSSSMLVHSLLLKRYEETSSTNLQLLDEATQAIQYNQSVLRTAFDQLDQGITVFDADHKLAFWNKQFRNLLELPREIGQAGTPLSTIVDEIAQKHWAKEKDHSAEELKARLLKPQPPWGLALPEKERILEIRSSAMPNGGLVIAWHDITERVLVAEALREANETLEKRVEQRTSDLVRANKKLELATKEADQANQSKTRFLSAAGHDLLQPLNAARLYASTLSETDGNFATAKLASNISRSLESVEEILGSVLAISRLDSPTHKLTVVSCALQKIFEQIELELTPMAKEKGLDFKIVPTSIWVRSDPSYLKRLIQNLVSNAINYTNSGKILVGCRLRGEFIEVSVIDTGLGICEKDREAIFSEFERLDDGAKLAPGLGLGLSIVERISKLLDHPVRFESEIGKGTHFIVAVPRTIAMHKKVRMLNDGDLMPGKPLFGLEVLCIDNDKSILEAMSGLLAKWECRVTTALGGAAALEAVRAAQNKNGRLPDIVLVDYHLDEENGIDVIKRLRIEFNNAFPCALVTANRSADLKKQAEEIGVQIINKPVKPAVLRALLSQMAIQRDAAE